MTTRLQAPRWAAQVLRCLRDQSGQAMAEYSTITFGILIGSAVMGVSIPFGPGHLTLVQQLYGALQVHVASIFYSLSLALP